MQTPNDSSHRNSLLEKLPDYQDKLIQNFYDSIQNLPKLSPDIRNYQRRRTPVKMSQCMINVFEKNEEKPQRLSQILDELFPQHQERRLDQNKHLLEAIMESSSLRSQANQFQFIQSSNNKFRIADDDFGQISQLSSSSSPNQNQQQNSKEYNGYIENNTIKCHKTSTHITKIKKHKKKQVNKDGDDSASQYKPQKRRKKKIKKNRGKKIKENSNILESANDSKNKNKQGCTCKKTKCQKKYCECFNSGNKCSEVCHCLECLNK